MELPEVRGSYRFATKLANSTWFGVGGKAEILYKPADIKDLQHFLRNKPEGLPLTVIGACSNTLIRDGGVDGVVIKLGRSFNFITLNKDSVDIGAATLNYNVSNYLADHKISGFEFLIGIPGSIGGGIAMNAGAYGSDFSSMLISILAVDLKGNLVEIPVNDMGYVYRAHSLSKPMIFVAGKFKINYSNKDDILKKMSDIASNREATQPIRSKTCGSTFKNPDGFKAWQLIEQAGCKGYQVGDAEVSTKHCNFLINRGNATAEDLENLAEEVRKKVQQNSGILLEWEIKRIGKK